MKVLVIGDEHTYGYGLPVGKLSYLGHFIRLVCRTGQPVSVEAYAHMTMSQIASTLAKLPLSHYDLIILQFDQRLLQPVSTKASDPSYKIEPALPYTLSAPTPRKKHWQRFKTFSTALLSAIWPSYGLKGIAALLKQLRPFRHNVLLITPLPHQEWTSRWLRKRSRAILLEEADEQLFSVFDTDSVIRPREEYFMPSDKEHLSVISHELLGRELYDFYQSAPTIVTVQTIRRNQIDS